MASTQARQPSQLVSYDPAEARERFARAPFLVGHELAHHPLFQLDALAELAERLPEDVVEHNLGSVDAVVPGGEVPRLDLPPGEIVRGIETNGCWIVLPIKLASLAPLPGYQEVHEAILDDVAPLVPGGRDAMSGLHGVIFVAGRGSTTPCHVDHETGFLLHMRGPKQISVGRFRDHAAEQEELERFFGGGHRNTDELPVGVEQFDLEPGQGVHVPPLKPHWVTNGTDVTISLNVGFQTQASLRRMGAYKFNAQARRMRLPLAAPGVHPGRDRLKASAVWTAKRARDVLRRG